MADKHKKVIYFCNWCGCDLHEVDDNHSMAPRAIYNDYDGFVQVRYLEKKVA